MVAATTLRVPLQLPQRQTQRTITIISSILTVVPQRLPPQQQQERPQRIRPHFSLSCWPNNRTEAAQQRLECSVHRRPLTALLCTIIIITITTTMGAMGVGVRALSSKAQGTVGRPTDAAATVAEAVA